MTVTATAAVPSDANSETLRGYLYATPGWMYHLTLDEGGQYPVAVFHRTHSPGRGTNVYVPYSDEIPEHLAQAANIINSIGGGVA